MRARLWFGLAALVFCGHRGANAQGVPFSSATLQLSAESTQSAQLAAHSGSTLLPFVVESDSTGRNTFDVITTDPGVVISLILPSSSEITILNASSFGFTFTVIADGTLSEVEIPSALSFPGTHTVIQIPAGQPSGTYQIKVNASNVNVVSGVAATYYSSSTVGTTTTTDSANYKVGDTVVLSGLIFDGATRDRCNGHSSYQRSSVACERDSGKFSIGQPASHKLNTYRLLVHGNSDKHRSRNCICGNTGDNRQFTGNAVRYYSVSADASQSATTHQIALADILNMIDLAPSLSSPLHEQTNLQAYQQTYLLLGQVSYTTFDSLHRTVVDHHYCLFVSDCFTVNDLAVTVPSARYTLFQEIIPPLQGSNHNSEANALNGMGVSVIQAIRNAQPVK